MPEVKKTFKQQVGEDERFAAWKSEIERQIFDAEDISRQVVSVIRSRELSDEQIAGFSRIIVRSVETASHLRQVLSDALLLRDLKRDVE